MSLDVAPPHPSEALLTQFEPHGLACTIATGNPDWTGGLALAHAATLLFTGFVTYMSFGDLSAFAVLGVLSLLLNALMLYGWYGITQNIQSDRVRLGPRHLEITRDTERGAGWVDRLELKSIATAHLLEQPDLPPKVRIVQDDGTETYIVSRMVPPASLNWLADQISHAARVAKSQPEGEVAPEMVALLDEETRQEAARKQKIALKQ